MENEVNHWCDNLSWLPQALMSKPQRARCQSKVLMLLAKCLVLNIPDYSSHTPRMHQSQCCHSKMLVFCKAICPMTLSREIKPVTYQYHLVKRTRLTVSSTIPDKTTTDYFSYNKISRRNLTLAQNDTIGEIKLNKTVSWNTFGNKL